VTEEINRRRNLQCNLHRFSRGWLREDPPGLGDILGDPGFQRVQRAEFLLGAQAGAEGDFDVLAVDVLVEIEEVEFQDALAGGGANGGADAEVDDAFERAASPEGGHGVHAVGGELLVVCAQIRGGKAEGAAELVAAHDCAEDRVVAAQQQGGASEVACLDGTADGGAGDDFAIDLDGGDADLVETEAVAHLAEHFEIAGTAAAEAPLVADADFAQRAAGVVQCEDEILGRRGGEFWGEGDDEDGLDAEGADEAELVGGGGEEARGAPAAEDFGRVGIERDGDGAAVAGAGIGQRAEEHGAMAEVDAIEYANGQVDGTGEGGEVRDGAEEEHWGKLKIRNQNGAKRHQPSIFLSEKTVQFEGLGAFARVIRDSSFSNF